MPSGLQGGKRVPVGGAQPHRSFGVVEAVAECDDEARRIAGDDGAKPPERIGGVVRRQQDVASRQTRALLEVQVRDREQPLLRPVERPRGVGNERNAGNDDAAWSRLIRLPPLRRHSSPP